MEENKATDLQFSRTTWRQTQERERERGREIKIKKN